MSRQQGSKINVYWLEQSRAQRVIWLLEELNLEYTIQVFKRNEEGRAGPELKKYHPLGRSPTIGITPDGFDKEVIITESETILDYICDYFGPQLIPQRYTAGRDGQLGAETEEWMRHKFLLDYAEGSFYTPLIVSRITSTIRNASPFFLRPIINGIADKIDASYTNPELANHLSFLENYLKSSSSQGSFFCTDKLTSADIMIHFALEGALKRKALTDRDYPALYEYVRRLQGSESYKRAGRSVEKATGEKFVPFSDA